MVKALSAFSFVSAELRKEQSKTINFKHDSNFFTQHLTVLCLLFFQATIRQLQKEKAIISHNIKRRKINNNLSKITNRNSLSSTTLFNPDSPLSFGFAKRVSKPLVLESQDKERGGEETLSYSDRVSKNTLDSTSRSVKRQLTPDCIGVQIYDEDSNLAPQRTVTSGIRQNAGSPGITSSISSKPPTDDEEASQPCQYDPHEISGKNPLGLDTPSESENETPD